MQQSLSVIKWVSCSFIFEWFIDYGLKLILLFKMEWSLKVKIFDVIRNIMYWVIIKDFAYV